MAIAPTFQKYLIAKNVVYDVVAHEPTKSSMRTAENLRGLGGLCRQSRRPPG